MTHEHCEICKKPASIFYSLSATKLRQGFKYNLSVRCKRHERSKNTIYSIITIAEYRTAKVLES